MTARIVKKQDHAAEQAPEAVKALAVMCEKGRFSFYVLGLNLEKLQILN